MEQEDLVSIIVPVYNVEIYLGECLQSVSNQTHKNIEVILVDDGSNDSSGSICDMYSRKDIRFHVIHQKNKGLLMARKIGARAACGKYIAFIDSDDWIDSNMIEELLLYTKEAHTDVVTSGIIYEYADGSSKTQMDGIPQGLYDMQEQNNIMRNNILYSENMQYYIFRSASTKLYRRELILKILEGVDEKLKCYGEEHLMSLGSILCARKVYVCHKAFYHYRQRDNSISASVDKSVYEQMTLVYREFTKLLNNVAGADFLYRQLDKYVANAIFDNIATFFGKENMFPKYYFENSMLKNGEKIILYGAGIVGQSYKRWMDILGNYEIVLWVDKNESNYCEKGFDVSSPQFIINVDYDKVVIAVKEISLSEVIKKELIRLGIYEHKIVWKEPVNIIERLFKL